MALNIVLPRSAGRQPANTFALASAAGALCAALAGLASGFGHRLGLWTYRTGWELLGAAAAVGAASALAALVAGLWGWRAGVHRALAPALVGIAAGGLTLGVPLAQIYEARSLPPIHDLSTDTENPPQFVALRALREASPNGAAYGGPALAAQQHRAYPDLQPLDYAVRPPVAFRYCLEAARALGWKIAAADPQALRIEASATTFFFGFQDDVVVRITPLGSASRIDVRSASRVGVRTSAPTRAAFARTCASSRA